MIGYTFQPGQDRQMKQSVNGAGVSPQVNRALQVLSLRLPRVLGGRPIAPGQMLQPHIGGTSAPGAVASTQAQQPSAAPASPAQPSAPPVSTPAQPAGVNRLPMAPQQTTSFELPGMQPSAPSGGSEMAQLASLIQNALQPPSVPFFRVDEGRQQGPTDDTREALSTVRRDPESGRALLPIRSPVPLPISQSPEQGYAAPQYVGAINQPNEFKKAGYAARQIGSAGKLSDFLRRALTGQ
ncbi:MAG: hypothetical protein NUW01_12245 [Gemmatimonadaceae bacterium]|nr:hypothetical protein [Gemmatimonadaceae bacterium]